MEEFNNEEVVISVSHIDDGNYGVTVREGISVEEIAFCMMVIIKCLERDNVVSSEEMLNLVNKYLTDPQYEEVKS